MTIAASGGLPYLCETNHNGAKDKDKGEEKAASSDESPLDTEQAFCGSCAWSNRDDADVRGTNNKDAGKEKASTSRRPVFVDYDPFLIDLALQGGQDLYLPDTTGTKPTQAEPKPSQYIDTTNPIPTEEYNPVLSDAIMAPGSRYPYNPYFEDGWVSDDEGHPELTCISPCTFARWAAYCASPSPYDSISNKGKNKGKKVKQPVIPRRVSSLRYSHSLLRQQQGLRVSHFPCHLHGVITDSRSFHKPHLPSPAPIPPTLQAST